MMAEAGKIHKNSLSQFMIKTSWLLWCLVLTGILMGKAKALRPKILAGFNDACQHKEGGLVGGLNWF